jgi:hypothetical protein
MNSFLVMNIIKTRFHNKIEYECMIDSLMLWIERKIAAKFSTNLIIYDFRDLKERRFELKIKIY